MATLREPLAKANEVGFLRVVSVGKYGAFVFWGLLKDLLVPYAEQPIRLQTGKTALVYVSVDRASNRMFGSTDLRKFIKNNELTVKEGQQVQLIVAEQTDLGFRVVINHQHWGMLYYNEVFKELQIGDSITGYIKKIREDNKLDVTLQQQGYVAATDANADLLLYHLRKNDGFLPLTDDSSPQAIYDKLGMSKKSFKRAVGLLYKQRLVDIEKNGVRLVEQEN